MTEQFPKKIWLQREEGEHPDCSTYNGEGMTWCEDKINKDDVEYMRADLVNQKIIQIAEKVVKEEPELPGDMPDAMWETVKNDRQAMRQAFRMTVRLTKDGILSRIKTLTEKEE